ncbi:DNA-binding transcriptional regulator, LysR family [Pseudomonas flavescens]|uniref:DNA-binding transcriptional regulator, LysR family n=1 Tax=Phytopseudomonas flavescens TaxID=29435 RepID=A0A1G8PUS1_9GAMM|nr:LysR substrate-binding domain-containing protein [Pseudomonas flavescens]SDI96207.1 DNA-binding transcriptional regulator, LysR family [Pseudomonas flavescens]
MAGRLLSFTQAAARLNLTQSAVSQQIRHLEERLGYPLFVRQPRALALTPNGAVLFEVSTRLISELQQTIDRLATPNAPLQINCLPSFTLQWLMPRLAEFNRQEPGISVRLKAEFQTLDRQSMDVQGIDLAVRYDPVNYGQLHTDHLMDEYLIPVATPRYLQRHLQPGRRLSLENAVLLHDAAPWAGAPEHIEWRTWLQAHMPDYCGPLEGPQFNLSCLATSAALNDQGIAMGRAALVYDDLVSGRLVNPFGTHVAAPARYVMLRRAENDHRVKVFAQWLTQACAEFVAARRAVLL